MAVGQGTGCSVLQFPLLEIRWIPAAFSCPSRLLRARQGLAQPRSPHPGPSKGCDLLREAEPGRAEGGRAEGVGRGSPWAHSSRVRVPPSVP